ncbi:hypothetical protein HBB16_08110 [Pseudonocardia sp. MCCB 268]|nr:hypothetical protein [Pseudonocardia cytotoxica]
MRAIGYPLPLFFQWDDVEYGYRAREHGFTHGLPARRRRVARRLPGGKDWDEWHRYFNQRNGLITAALRTRRPAHGRHHDRRAAGPVPGRDAVRPGRDHL